MTGDQAPFHDIQRMVLRPSRARYVTHFPLRIPHAETAQERKANLRAALRALREFANGGGWTLGDTTLAEDAGEARSAAEAANAEQVALGFTVRGLRALGLGRGEIETFPFDFRQGPADRAEFLGDVDCNGPEHWEAPFTPTDDERKQIHAVVSVWSESLPAVPAVLAAEFETVGEVGRLQCDRGDDKRREWFGYSDGDSQPYIAGLKYGTSTNRHPSVPLGEFVVGYPTELGDVSLRWRVPGTDKEPHERVGWNSTFAALRVMEQRPEEFTTWLEKSAQALTEEGVTKELVAAWVCGRSRPGSEKELPNWRHPPGNEPFDFSEDLDGQACPIGSHIRRAHPRNGWTGSRGAHRRRIIRRGAPYGIGDGAEAAQNEWVERGLVGYFICANLSAQYEAVLTDWIHGGVHDPWISGTNDPLIGRQPRGGGIFRHDDSKRVYELRVPQFVFTKGVAYLFLPGRTGLERLVKKCEAGLP